MRIRSIKPEFWRSSDISTLDWESRLLFIGLWSYVDDNGVGLDKLASIAADLFADDLERDSSETFARVSRGLQNLSEAGRIIRYEVSGKKYLSITNWEKHQRIDKPNKPRYPRNDAENAVTQDEFATPSRQSRETPATGTEEQGNRGTEDVKVPSPLRYRSAGKPTMEDKMRDAQPIPDDFAMTDTMQAWALRTIGTVRRIDLQLETERFMAHAREKNITSSSWPDTWRKWIVNAVEFYDRDQAAAGGPGLTKDQLKAQLNAPLKFKGKVLEEPRMNNELRAS